MKVKTLRADFKKEFGLALRIYDGRSFADDNATLASIRKGDSVGGEFAPQRNTKVGNLEDKIMDMFGIKTQVAGSDDSYLCDNDLTLAGALEADEKLMSKRSKRSSKDVKTESETKTAEPSRESGELTAESIISKVKDAYKDHDDVDEMVSDLEGGDYFDYWAEKFATDDYNKQIDLAKMMFAYFENKAETSSDYLDLMDKVSDSDGLNDKVWAKKLYSLAEEKASTYNDFRQLAISCKEIDEKKALVLYKEAAAVAESSYDLWILARDIISFDIPLAKELYKKAEEKTEIFRDYLNIAEDVVKFDNEWAEDITQLALKVANAEETKVAAEFIKFSLSDSKLSIQVADMTQSPRASSAMKISDQITYRVNAWYQENQENGDVLDEAKDDTKEEFDLWDIAEEEGVSSIDELVSLDRFNEDEKMNILRKYVEKLEEYTGANFSDTIE